MTANTKKRRTGQAIQRSQKKKRGSKRKTHNRFLTKRDRRKDEDCLRNSSSDSIIGEECIKKFEDHFLQNKNRWLLQKELFGHRTITRNLSQKLSLLMFNPNDFSVREFNEHPTESTSGLIDDTSNSSEEDSDMEELNMVKKLTNWKPNSSKFAAKLSNFKDLMSARGERMNSREWNSLATSMDCDYEVGSESDEDPENEEHAKIFLQHPPDTLENAMQQMPCNSIKSVDCCIEVLYENNRVENESDIGYKSIEVNGKESNEVYKVTNVAGNENEKVGCNEKEIARESIQDLDGVKNEIFSQETPDINEAAHGQRTCRLRINSDNESDGAIEHDEILSHKIPSITENNDNIVSEQREPTKIRSCGVQTVIDFEFIKRFESEAEKRDSSIQVDLKEISDSLNCSLQTHESSSLQSMDCDAYIEDRELQESPSESPRESKSSSTQSLPLSESSLASSVPNSSGNLSNSSSEKLSNKNLNIKSKSFSYNIASGDTAINFNAKKLQSFENGSIYWIKRHREQFSNRALGKHLAGSKAVKKSSSQNTLNDHSYDEPVQCDTVFSYPIFTPLQSYNNSSIESLSVSAQCSDSAGSSTLHTSEKCLSQKIPDRARSLTDNHRDVEDSSVLIDDIVYNHQCSKMETSNADLPSIDYSSRFIDLAQVFDPPVKKIRPLANKVLHDNDWHQPENVFNSTNQTSFDSSQSQEKKAKTISVKYMYRNFIEPRRLNRNIKVNVNNSDKYRASKDQPSLCNLVSSNSVQYPTNRSSTSTEKISSTYSSNIFAKETASANIPSTSTERITPENRSGTSTELTTANNFGTSTEITPTNNSTTIGKLNTESGPQQNKLSRQPMIAASSMLSIHDALSLIGLAVKDLTEIQRNQQRKPSRMEAIGRFFFKK